MRMNRATEALVAFEDSAPDGLFASVPGTSLPLWPLMRWPVASAMANTEYSIRLADRVESAGSKARRMLRSLAPGASSRRGDCDVLFVGTGNMTAQTPAGVRNLLLEDFAETIGDRAAILQDSPLVTVPSFPRTTSFDNAIVRAELAVRLRPDRARATRTERIARELIGAIEFEIEPELVERAVRTTLARVQRAPRVARAFGALLDRMTPRTIVMQAAAYGDRAALIGEAHRRGIFVAEPQHGWIGAAHAAYNFGQAASDPRLLDSLPDVLLTFGEAWGEHIAVPFELVAVGKPHLEAARERVAPPGDRELRVLVASGLVHPEATSAFVLQVRDALPDDWRVTFRPHPQERTDVARRYPALLTAPRVDIDDRQDIYESFGRVRLVIGGPSTTLYEALALDCPVVLRRSNITDFYMDPAVFTATIDEGEHPGPVLDAVIRERGTQVDPTLREQWWAPQPRERFANWAASLPASRTLS